ncbi:MAG: hypothetical protein JWR12_2517 [Mucilaginibacter sp.]|nr:hypothetical protein [Mucilaginibacter sp.]
MRIPKSHLILLTKTQKKDSFPLHRIYNQCKRIKMTVFHIDGFKIRYVENNRSKSYSSKIGHWQKRSLENTMKILACHRQL